MSLSGKKILLGVSGGIAAYKAVSLLRDLQNQGAEVRVTMTRAASRFVGVETFSTLSRRDVAVDVFNNEDPGDTWTRHIHWAEWADLFVIAPCTANTLAKLVHGLADNMLTSIALASRCPVLVCPTMDAGMINHPAVNGNLKLAKEQGLYLLEPESGYLASGMEGTGRLPEPESILHACTELLLSGPHGLLAGKKVLVTAGPTQEPIDAVRHISNPSSGKMGIAMAEAARSLGGDVTLLHGPVPTPLPAGMACRPFRTADDLFQLAKEHADADLVIMAAAVSDYRPSDPKKEKVKKGSARIDLQLIPTPDTLQWFGENRRKDQVLIGFAMETENLEENARTKLKNKNLDWICANDLTDEGSGFRSDTNRIHLIHEEGVQTFTGSKRAIANEILRSIFDS